MDSHRLVALLHLPKRRQAIRIAGAAALVALICWYFGVDALHSLLLGAAITVIAAPSSSECSASTPKYQQITATSTAAPAIRIACRRVGRWSIAISRGVSMLSVLRPSAASW